MNGSQGCAGRHGTATAEARALGIEIRRLRMADGLTQADLAHRIGRSAHSVLSDYECGWRIPPADIVDACAAVLGDTHGYLDRLRHDALRARARAWARSATAEFSSDAEEGPADDLPEDT